MQLTHMLLRAHIHARRPAAVEEAPPSEQVLADVLSVLAPGWFSGFGGL